jgi:hypothetical protein
MRRRALVPLLLAVAVVRPLTAQTTGDEARLTFTIGLGYSFGQELWSVGQQPYFLSNTVDTFAISRRLRESVTAYLGGTYFRGKNIGFTGELSLVGLGTTLSCADVSAGGSNDTHAVCNALNGVDRGGTSVLLTGGPVLRLASRSALSPYVQATAGLLLTSRSTVETSTFVATTEDPNSLIRIYSDSKSTDVSFGGILSAGIIAQAGHGYQFRVEVRDNIVGVRRITGATPRDGDQPTVDRVFKHVPAIVVGFGVILERRRGRRY